MLVTWLSVGAMHGGLHIAASMHTWLFKIVDWLLSEATLVMFVRRPKQCGEISAQSKWHKVLFWQSGRQILACSELSWY